MSWWEVRLFLRLAPGTYHLRCVGHAAIECGANTHAIGDSCLFASRKQFLCSADSPKLLSGKLLRTKLLPTKQVLGRMFLGMLWRIIPRKVEMLSLQAECHFLRHL